MLTKDEYGYKQIYSAVIIGGMWLVLVMIMAILVKIGRHPNAIEEDEIEEMYGTLEADLDL